MQLINFEISYFKITRLSKLLLTFCHAFLTCCYKNTAFRVHDPFTQRLSGETGKLGCEYKNESKYNVATTYCDIVLIY